MSNAPSNTDDTIDSRDVIARIEELQAERDDLQNDVAEATQAYRDCREPGENEATAMTDANDVLADWDKSDEAEELRVLLAFAEEGESLADWAHGEVLIHDAYFQTYAQELADDLGLIPRDTKWPATCIDWEQAARELQMDYTAIDFDGTTYWGRA